MASYQPTILPAPQQYGFLPGLLQGLGQGVNAYAQGAYQDFFDKRQQQRQAESTNKYKAAMEQGGYDIDKIEMSADGTPKYTFKPKGAAESAAKAETMKDPAKAIKLAMAGISPANGLGDFVNIQEQEPSMSLATGQTGDASGAPVVDQSEAIRKALLSKYAPGYTEDQIKAGVLGLPKLDAKQVEQAKPSQVPAMMTPDGQFADATGAAIEDKFSGDIENLKSQLKTTDEWLAALNVLVMKYANDPEALRKIGLLQQRFSSGRKSSPSSSSSNSETEYFGENWVGE